MRMHTSVSIPEAHENPHAEGLLSAKHRIGCSLPLRACTLLGEEDTRGQVDAACDNRCLALPSGEAQLRGDTELTDAPRGGKPGGNPENKQAEPRPRGRKTPTCVGNIPAASVARGGEQKSCGRAGVTAHSVPLDWNRCEGASSCRKGCEPGFSPARRRCSADTSRMKPLVCLGPGPLNPTLQFTTSNTHHSLWRAPSGLRPTLQLAEVKLSKVTTAGGGSLTR